MKRVRLLSASFVLFVLAIGYLPVQQRVGARKRSGEDSSMGWNS